MQYLKKYFMEGLIQMAILLSLCGVRVDVGLPPSWHEMILGPTSALTQTQFHNLRSHLEDGQGLHPKSVDLDGFFTARRLLGWVHSLDRLQVPRAELDTWLVQREPDPVPVGLSGQTLPLAREPAGVQRNQSAPSVDPRSAPGALQDEEEEDEEEETHLVLHHGAALDERGEEEEEEEEEDLARTPPRRTEGGGRPGGSAVCATSELTENEGDQTSVSLQECLRLLEENFPLGGEQPLHHAGGREEDLESQSQDQDPTLLPVITTGNPSLDLELHWQDLLAVMEPEDTGVNTMTSFDLMQNSAAAETLQGVWPDALQQHRNSHDTEIMEAHREVAPMESPQQHGLLGPLSRSERDVSPLTPSVELDDSALSTRCILKHSEVNPSRRPTGHVDLLADEPSEGFFLGLNAEDDSVTFNMNLQTQQLMDTMEGRPCLQRAPDPENRLPTPPSSVFLFDEEDEEGLPSPLGNLLEDAAILDRIRLLDLALEEGFSPELVARLDEEGYLHRGIAQQETGKDDDDQSGSSTAATEDQDQPRRHQQRGDSEADSDSGLSLDFSNGHASPCALEASTYSSPPSSCITAEGSTFSEDEDEDAEEGLVGSHMEVEVAIKQEELDEEELGAVGGGYAGDFKKLFPPSSRDDNLLSGLPLLEHVDHDHTYNQPWESASSPSLGKMPTKPTKSSLRHVSAKPYHSSSSRHISEGNMWSRDERRSRALKVPFSNYLIVNLPVEDFNDLMANFQLSEDQLALVRDIRRRGKNKIAAQNCRKRKMDGLLALNDDVSSLIRRRSWLLREKQETLRNLQKMKRQLGKLYQEVFSRLRDEDGRPLDTMDHLLHFEPNGSVMVATRHQGAALAKSIKKQRVKRK